MGNDYFDSRNSEASIDIEYVVGGWGKATPSLNEIATPSGIPGKIDVDAKEIAFLWLDGKLDEIVAYNEFDALTTIRIEYRSNCGKVTVARPLAHVTSSDLPSGCIVIDFGA